ncbi:hypothetical protein EG329_005894 [Mollisiaceae sp. DMI_Dod_QoI]|nr:hypothetical protein EG329_005894 [Helotiales sp. DMI_Dod_QoI]
MTSSKDQTSGSMSNKSSAEALTSHDTVTTSSLLQTALQKPSLLSNLPQEIHLEIFDHLDRVSATCLGLTSVAFYALYKRHLQSIYFDTPYGRNIVRLYEWTQTGPVSPLYELLEEWFGPEMYYQSRCWDLRTRTYKGGRYRFKANSERPFLANNVEGAEEEVMSSDEGSEDNEDSEDIDDGDDFEIDQNSEQP